MPELPEVEVTRLGITDHLVGRAVAGFFVHGQKLGATIPAELAAQLTGQRIQAVERRGKYLILRFATGSLLVHLGMTGHLRVVPGQRNAGPHDTLDILLNSGQMLRLNDPRRFGSLHWTAADPFQHKLLASIGPEPLTSEFTGAYLFRRSRGKKVAVQPFIMDSSVVAGVGNIYAAESLFRCGILPTTPAGNLPESHCEELAASIRQTLTDSIAAGRSTMKFDKEEDKLVYFPQTLYVYGREGQPCRRCGDPVVRGRFGKRSTFFCPNCQR
ncbi:formamidopyrimidine-DNA glycosylase [Geomonas sp. Red276]